MEANIGVEPVIIAIVQCRAAAPFTGGGSSATGGGSSATGGGSSATGGGAAPGRAGRQACSAGRRADGACGLFHIAEHLGRPSSPTCRLERVDTERACRQAAQAGQRHARVRTGVTARCDRWRL
jgi:hypothetical protein